MTKATWFGIVVTTWLAATAAGAEEGTLSVLSAPEGAAIQLDGEDTGERTPHTFAGMTEGSHLVRVELEGYLPKETQTTLVVGESTEVLLSLVPPPPTTARFLNAEESELSWLERPAPTYPISAKQQGLEGTVVVSAIFGLDGASESVEVVEGPSLFHKNAVRAVEQWRIEPHVHEGEPTRVRVRIRIEFKLR